ncbi:sensor histidine kinase [Pseudactinotalea suaedae]|uniref:sensor histidine kinase n=1 Tax=Pseudactinotalea suaedae TaxID=1524924 RepID=UPI0012E22EA2|nr:histidine kinase [Pseudactinotalea suaedae]
MDRRDPNLWAGAFGLLVCLGLGLVFLLLQLQGAEFTSVAPALWWASYVLFMLTLVAAQWLVGVDRVRLAQALFAVQVVLGIVIVVTAPGAGWLPILVVYTAALSAYVVSWRVTAVIVAANTAAVAAASWISSSLVLETVLSGGLYAMLQLGTYFAVRAQHREVEMRTALAAAHAELRATSTLLAESSRADERLRISRDLHDAVGHQLTVLALELEIASHRATPPASEHVARARGIAGDLLADVRQTVGELRRRAPDLRDVLERIVADLPSPRIHVEVADDVELDEIRTVALVRCVQEVVTNAIRHAQAANLWIEVANESGAVVLTAWDDGRGAARLEMGNGLRGISERVADLGGDASFTTMGGFRVEARVPVS